ncbi:hypothetical protein Q7C36_023313 [Tachysurus vachellii]|uniref:Cadherin domain-containing protein n=1 Tax=Tachysurus vachellii TaxID=175792 RepID=A0AA88IYE6_TACVA|nr:hypothetical protein Q7C36_023313 [Tachysurus vachellii]
MISFIPGSVGSDQRLSRQRLSDSQRTEDHRGFRVKRGWIWNQLSVEEEDPTPKIIGQLKSTYDTGDFAISYILSGEGAEDIFNIDEFSGEIHVHKSLDREKKAFYVLHAEAVDRRTGQPVEPESEFIIKVQDINDNSPHFINEPYTSSIPEMSPIGTTVFQVTAIDADDPMFGNNAKLIYSILQGEPYFSVEPKTGTIVTSWPNIDREASEKYFVVIQVKDMLGNTGGYSATTTVTITLIDVNDNGPTFQHNLYTFAILESAPVGTAVGRVMAKDADVGINARMNYTLDDLEESGTFRVQTDPATEEGIVILARVRLFFFKMAVFSDFSSLDYEHKRRFVIAIEAINSFVDTRFLSINEFRDRTMLKILVMDVDEPPVFSAPFYEWKVLENALVGTLVGTIYARDADAANNPISFSISNNFELENAFRIDTNNGTVFLVTPLDRETVAWQNITVIAKETNKNQLSSVSVVIQVLDVNDNIPTLSRDYKPYVCEGAQAGEVIQVISAVDADDPAEGHHFYFSMVADKIINPNFTIRDNQDNTAGILTRRSTFTHHDHILYQLHVVITDSGSPALSSTATFTISVCVCQFRGHCQSSGTKALAISMGFNMQALLGLSVFFIIVIVLALLIVAVWRHRTVQQQKPVMEELDTEGYSRKIIHYEESEGIPDVHNQIPLRTHTPCRKNTFCREELVPSVHLSLCHSHLIDPEDEVFRLFMIDRLAEADQDTCVPPYDCLHYYVFEGTGSLAGSLSSLESSNFDPYLYQPFLRLSRWQGASDYDTSF